MLVDFRPVLTYLHGIDQPCCTLYTQSDDLKHTHKLIGFPTEIRQAFVVAGDSPKTNHTAQHLHVRTTALWLSNALPGSQISLHCRQAKPSHFAAQCNMAVSDDVKRIRHVTINLLAATPQNTPGRLALRDRYATHAQSTQIWNQGYLLQLRAGGQVSLAS